MISALTCGVCLPTHNRLPELRRTVERIAALDPAPSQIQVTADGCHDGTVEYLREAHPSVEVTIHETAAGSIPSRNEMLRQSRCDLVLSLDDDSYPVETDAIARIIALFESNTRLAVAAFPQRSDEVPASLDQRDFGPAHFTGTYASSAAAIRKQAFLEAGGYCDFFFHAYEEPDFALRCLAGGWEVRFEPAITIRHHFTSLQRNEVRTHQRHARNEFWSVLLRCSFPQLLGVAAFRIARQARYAASRGPRWLLQEPNWWFAAAAGVSRCAAQRKSVPWPIYLSWMRLVRNPVQSRDEWERRFGPAIRRS